MQYNSHIQYFKMSSGDAHCHELILKFKKQYYFWSSHKMFRKGNLHMYIQKTVLTKVDEKWYLACNNWESMTAPQNGQTYSLSGLCKNREMSP